MDTDTDRILVIPNDVFFSRVCESLGEGGKVTFTVKGHSMFPFLRSGKDRVCLVKPESGGLAAGDVILFRFRGNYILHRIYGIRKTPDGTPLYVTMGDGNTRIQIRPNTRTTVLFNGMTSEEFEVRYAGFAENSEATDDAMIDVDSDWNGWSN